MYCHELYPCHQKILNDGLRLLLKHSESLDLWAHDSNPLCSLVRFTSPDVLTEVSQSWKLWLEMHVPVNHMHSSRRKWLKKVEVYFGTREDHASTCVRDVMSVWGESPEGLERRVTALSPELLSYDTYVSSYAESVFQTDLPATSTIANVTLYESKDCEYTLFYASSPFLTYFHTVDFSPEAMSRAGAGKGACDSALVPDESFKTRPLLANSVQQFSMWVQSSSAVLNQGKSITFTFNNQNALALHHMQNGNQFDVVFSSNLLDHLGLPNVLVSALPLLKLDGLLYTASMLYKHTDMRCLEDYLQTSFGFDCKLLPVILGVRCINHEGKGYASPVLIEPPPVESQTQRLFVWQKVSGQPMKISKLPSLQSGNVTEGLVNAFIASTLPLMSTNNINNEDTMLMIRSNCIETAMHVLQIFVSSVNADNDYHFFEPLCAGVKLQLKSFLSGLQTQALLHNLHMHFTVDENSCPLCRRTPIEEFLGFFCAKVSIPPRTMQPHFMALIHPYSSLEGRKGQSLGLYDRDIHVIDCLDGIVQNDQVLLKFFAPKIFAENNLNVTICLSEVFRAAKKAPPKSGVNPLSTTDLRSIQVDFVHYSFSGTTCSVSFRSVQSFGDLISNSYTGYDVVSDVALSDALLDNLSLSSLKTSCVSSDEIQLTCGPLEFNLKYVYPIDYNGIKIKLSKARRNVRIISPRRAHHFDEERPVSITYPDCQLSLPPLHVDNETLERHFATMLMASSAWSHGGGGKFAVLFDPQKDTLSRVKSILDDFFLFRTVVDFHLVSSGKQFCGQVIVNNRMFDYEHRVPVLDLAFYFPENHSKPTLRHAKRRNKTVPVSDTECSDLKRVLLHFAKQTTGDIKTASTRSIYQDLIKGGVDKNFTRAVVYYLYSDPEGVFRGMSLAAETTKAQCSFCNKLSDLKTCKQCGEARYCDKECQAKHWPRHKAQCKKLAKTKKRE